jgi:hypothetical protein
VTPFPRQFWKGHLCRVDRVYSSEGLWILTDPFPDGLVEKFRKLIFERIKFVDPEESETLQSILDQRIRQWKTVRPIHWRPQPGNSEDIPLMKVAGTLFEQTHGLLPLPTMQSMRSVDMECMAEIRYPAVEGDS